MIIATLLIAFSLNIINHGNIVIGILNSLLLFFSIIFFLKFSQQNLSSIKSLSFISPLFLLIAAIPLFTYKHDIFILLLVAGIVPLFLLYLNIKFTKLKLILVFVILLYLILASLYANKIVSFPFLFNSNLFLSSDYWTNLYISQMQKEALYLPYKIRFWVFNNSVYFYIMLSKIAGLFMFKNLYEVLLIANLYPLIKGLILDLKKWDKSRTFLILCMMLISFIMVSSRTVNVFDVFILLSPFLMYFILRGFSTINKIVYLALFIFSIVITTSPSK